MREPESKVAPEAISAPIPDDLKRIHELAMRHAKSGHPWRSASQTIVSLIERIASLTAQVATLEQHLGALESEDAPDELTEWINIANHRQEQIMLLEQQLRAMTEDRDLWQGEHNEDCPNKARADELEQQLDVQSFPERLAIWKALGFPEGYSGNLVAAVRDAVAEKAAAHEAERQLRQIGNQMSNVCFNWSQHDRFSETERTMLRDLYRSWDEARSLSAPTKEQPK